MVANDRNHRESWVELRETEDAQRLHEFEAFKGFSQDELKQLVQAAHHDSVSAPWPLIHERTPSDACYILLSGEAGVYVGRDQVATVGSGEIIGESALRQGQLRSATVTTKGPAEMLRIERDDLADLLTKIPALRELIDTSAARHAQGGAAHAAAATEAEPKRAKIPAAVPVELVAKFEKAASKAGLDVATALEKALTDWIGNN